MARPDLRVLFLQGAGVRAGAERALLARLRHLPEHAIIPAVAFMADGPFRAEVERADVETLLLREAPQLRELTRVPAAVRAVEHTLREQRIDAIEGCGEKMSVLAGWAGRLAGVPTVYTPQDRPRRDRHATAAQLAALSGRHDE